VEKKVISVAGRFTRYPAGRYRTDGPFSGQQFREEHLLPILRAGETAIIELDGTRGYGSSFLEEAFGGLVRDGFSPEQVLATFEMRSSDKSLLYEIEEYIRHGAEANVGA
jgi:STAS-like domain of unknown function (DUF4325)